MEQRVRDAIVLVALPAIFVVVIVAAQVVPLGAGGAGAAVSAFDGTFVGIAVALWIIGGVYAVAAGRRNPFIGRFYRAVPAGATASLACLVAISRVTDPYRFGWPALVATLAVMAGVSALAWKLAGPAAHPLATGGPGVTSPRVRLDGPAVWSGTTAWTKRSTITLLLNMGAVVTYFWWRWEPDDPSFWSLWVIVVLSFTMSLPWRVVIGPRSVVMRAVAGLPRVVVPVDSIEHASVAAPPRWPWGFAPFRRSINTGIAPRLQLHRGDGSTVTVTLAQAEEAAAVVNAIIDRSGRPHAAPDRS